MGWNIEPRTIKKPIENTMKKKKASWRRLGGLLARLGDVLGFENPSEAAGGGWRRLEAGAVAETQGPLLGRIPEGLEY